MKKHWLFTLPILVGMASPVLAGGFCGSDSLEAFSCNMKKGKILSVCIQGGYTSYYFGKYGKVELSYGGHAGNSFEYYGGKAGSHLEFVNNRHVYDVYVKGRGDSIGGGKNNLA